MPKLLIILLLLSFTVIAQADDCHQEFTQSDKNECMSFLRDQAIGKLMTRVTQVCANKLEVSESDGGSIYPMVLDECMIQEISRLTKEVGN